MYIYIYLSGDKYTLTHRWWFQPLVNQIDLRIIKLQSTTPVEHLHQAVKVKKPLVAQRIMCIQI